MTTVSNFSIEKSGRILDLSNSNTVAVDLSLVNVVVNSVIKAVVTASATPFGLY